MDSIFKVNGNFVVEIKHGPYKGKYSSRIEEQTDDALEIAIPSKQGHLLPLPVGTWFIGKVTQSSNLYVFKTQITRIDTKQNVPTWTVKKPKEIEKLQRREYVRLDVRLPVSIKIHIADENILSIEGKKYSAKELNVKEWEACTKDISGSGARIITKLEIPEGTKVGLTFQLPENDAFYTLAKVKRVDLINPELGIYWIGVHFVGLSERGERSYSSLYLQETGGITQTELIIGVVL